MLIEHELQISDLALDTDQSPQCLWLADICLGRKITFGGMSEVYEVEGVPFQDTLIAKKASRDGLDPKEIVRMFPYLATVDLDQDVIPLDIDNLIEWEETIDGQVHAGIFSKLASRFPDNSIALRTFIEALTLHRLAQKDPILASGITRAHGIVLIKGEHGLHHPTIIMDKVTRSHEGNLVPARSLREVMVDVLGEPHLLKRKSRVIRLLSHLEQVGQILDRLAATIPITHRDIKPENLLLRNEYSEELPPLHVDYPEEQLVVADWGTALTKRDTLGKGLLGTPDYAAPEQYQNSADAVPTSDQYPIGIMIAETLGATKAVTSFTTGLSPIAKIKHALENPTYHKSLPLWIAEQMGIELPYAMRIADFIRVSGHKEPEKRFKTNADLIRPIISLLLGEDRYMTTGLEGMEIPNYDESDFTFDNTPNLFMRRMPTALKTKTTEEPQSGVITPII